MPRLRPVPNLPPILQDILDEVEADPRTGLEILRAAGLSPNVLTNIRRGDNIALPTILALAETLNCIPRLLSKEKK